jgi:hypothetical protein
MQFALMIYHTPEEFGMRKNDYSDPRLGAWRAYYQSLAQAGVYVGADALEVPETGTTVRVRDGRRRVQDGPYADTKEQLAGFIILELPSVDAALEWAARCPGASIGAVEVRRSARSAQARLFSRWFDDIMGGKHVVVVVVSEVTGRRHWVITAYLISKLGQGDVEWTRS